MTISDGDVISFVHSEDDDGVWLDVLVNGLRAGPSIGPFASAEDCDEANKDLLNRMTQEGIDYEEVTKLQ